MSPLITLDLFLESNNGSKEVHLLSDLVEEGRWVLGKRGFGEKRQKTTFVEVDK